MSRLVKFLTQMFQCRINADELTEGQHVVTKTLKIEDGIVTVELMEYHGTVGLIMPNELSRKRIKNASQATKLGKVEVCQVLKIENANIDLSLKQVDPEEKGKTLEQYKKNRLAYSIAEKIAKASKTKAKVVYDALSAKIEKFGSLYDTLAYLKENREEIDEKSPIEVDTLSVIEKEFKPSSFKVRADIDVNCYRNNGCEIIRNALGEGAKMVEGIEINLFNTPTFSVTMNCINKEDGFNTLNKVLDVIKASIEKQGGDFHLINAPKVYGEKSKHNALVLKEKEEESSSSSSDE